MKIIVYLLTYDLISQLAFILMNQIIMMGSRIIISILSFLFLLSPSGKAQEDSSFSADTTTISNLTKECRNLIFIDVEATSGKIDSILLLAKKHDYRFGMYKGYNLLGIKYYILNDYMESIKWYSHALQYVDKNKRSQELNLYGNISYAYSALGISDSVLYFMTLQNTQAELYQLDKVYIQSLLDLGIFYLGKSDYTIAASYFTQVEHECKSTSDSIYLIKAYSSLAQFYHKLEDFDQAYSFYQKAIEIDKKISQIDFLPLNFSNMGEMFFRLKNNYDTAIYFYNKSVELSLHHAKARTILQTNINIGNVFLEKDNIDSSFYYYSKAYEDPLLQNLPVYQAAIYTNIGIYYQKKAKYIKAKEFLLKGLHLSRNLDLLVFRKNALSQLWQLEEAQANYSKSLDYHKEYHQVSDSINEQEA
ncbi:MAG: tetratricopeptide repeat protein, partial [Bacteroidales bacterium]|nr:tetratricopeptide repeat protein [Bacteroidales bacterium]